MTFVFDKDLLISVQSTEIPFMQHLLESLEITPYSAAKRYFDKGCALLRAYGGRFAIREYYTTYPNYLDHNDPQSYIKIDVETFKQILLYKECGIDDETIRNLIAGE